MTTEKTPSPFVIKAKKALKTAFNWVIRYPVALVISILVIIIFILLAATPLGKALNPGKIIKKLFGKWSHTPSKVEDANTVDKDRELAPGETDEGGSTQTKAAKIKVNTNPFRDKEKIIVVNPETGEEDEVHLPDGVTDKDVERVTHVRAKTYLVGVKTKKGKTPELGGSA